MRFRSSFTIDRFQALINARALLGVLVAVIAIYAIQAFSPIRLDNDSAKYLLAAHSMSDSKTALFNTIVWNHPVGYPWMLSKLVNLGLDSSFTFVFLNLFFLLLTLLSMYFLYRRNYEVSRGHALFLLIMCTLSYLTVKHVSLISTEVMFLGLSCSCLAVLSFDTAAGPKMFLQIVVALILAYLSFKTRLLGSLLFAVVGFWILLKYLNWKNVSLSPIANLVLFALSIGGAIILILIVLKGAPYLNESKSSSGINLTDLDFRKFFQQSVLGELIEVGRVGLNIPKSLSNGGLQSFLILPGVIFLFVFLTKINWKSLTHIDLYLIAYGGAIFVWPFEDPRAWLPILPLLLPYLLFPRKLGRDGVITDSIVGVWLAVFLFFGFASLAHSTRLTFSGDDFVERYGSNAAKVIYRAVASGSNPPVDNPNFDARLYKVLKYYAE